MMERIRAGGTPVNAPPCVRCGQAYENHSMFSKWCPKYRDPGTGEPRQQYLHPDEPLVPLELDSPGGPPRTLYWRPCPFFCPEAPDYFRSWASLMLEVASIKGPITIDVPEATPFPRGRWELRGSSIIVSELTKRDVIRSPGRRIHYAGRLTWVRRGTRTRILAGWA